MSDEIMAQTDAVLTIIPLASLAADINREHLDARRCAAQSLAHAKRAGDLLQQVKAALPHGAWLPWLAEHCEVSPRMAQGYMRIAAEWPTLTKTQRVADLPVRRALALLETPTTPAERFSGRDTHYLGSRKGQDRSNRIVATMVLEAETFTYGVDQIDLTKLDESCLIEWAQKLRKAARQITTFAARLERATTSLRRAG